MTRLKSLPKPVLDLVKSRDETGLCEVGQKCGGFAAAEETAHRLGRQSGGVGKKNTTKNVASNLLRACTVCHDWMDKREVRRAERLGLKVRDGVALPSEIPVLHTRFEWVLLDDAGDFRAAPAASYVAGLIPVVGCTPWELIQQNGAFSEAMERYKHTQCPGWPAPLEGLFTCGCGSSPFVVQVVA
ncbi:hypothetical protein ACBJ59_36295 [Nonomuraea sp. MTCD27]|uniref:hypothetical protein n=1 Tax=Nonomuraea sp. MTCD27 TaxID=1676747 RepID=UPI0035C22BAD